jgi:predicted RNase H-like nuclease (RuvC/YqgF family)
MGTLSGRGNASGETKAIFPEVPAHGRRTDEELGVPRRCLYKWRTKLEAAEPGEEAARPSTHASAHRKEILQLKRLLAEKAMEVDFLKGALQKVEARRQRSSGSGGKASTNKSEN